MRFILVLTTCPTRPSALKIARQILEKKLAACVQISSPVKSIYRWKGRVERSQEVQVWIKARASSFKKIQKQISIFHPYEVPEIISIPILQGSQDYLSWIEKETGK
ncbi:MAG: divalent-cation tolerance protein CutA [Bacteriovoracaceae bacterium]|nr:divalent-cation tolerance protein CutA [Bacteriovoracaceae bacterium]